jgi:AraC-like DNA-binding protein
MTRLDIHNLEWEQIARQLNYKATAMSEKLGISQRQLHRYTRELFGFSPQRWLKRQQLVVSADLLVKHRSVKFVSFQLGFKQPSHFCREFKLYYGLSPSAFLTRTCQKAALTSSHGRSPGIYQSHNRIITLSNESPTTKEVNAIRS